MRVARRQIQKRSIHPIGTETDSKNKKPNSGGADFADGGRISKLFRKGAERLSATLHYAKRLLKRGMIYVGIVTNAALVFRPENLKDEASTKQNSSGISALAAPIPVLRASQYFFGCAYPGLATTAYVQASKHR
jgi:hypothetical protein